MNILVGYIIIAFLSFLGFNLYDFIDFNFSFKKAIKHPFSFLYCFLYEGIKEFLLFKLFLSIFWPISLLMVLIICLESLFEDKIKAFLEKSSKKIDEKYREARQKIRID